MVQLDVRAGCKDLSGIAGIMLDGGWLTGFFSGMIFFPGLFRQNLFRQNLFRQICFGKRAVSLQWPISPACDREIIRFGCWKQAGIVQW